MKTILTCAAVLALSTGAAFAQTASSESTTTTTYPAPPPLPPVVQPPPVGTLSTTHTEHSVDAYGNQIDQKRTTYRNDQGVAEDSQTTRTIVPPPPVSTTTTTTNTTTNIPQ